MTRPPALLASAFAEPLGRGRNSGSNIMCEAIDGANISCAIKMNCSPREHMHEWFASHLLRVIGVHVPEPYEVIVTRDFMRSLSTSLHGDERRQAVRALKDLSEVSCFGCTFVANTTPLPLPLPATMVPDAVHLFLADLFISNDDRRPTNPNVLVAGDHLVAIDHELAFSFLQSVGRLSWDELAANHVFGALARDCSNAMKTEALARFRHCLASATSATWTNIRASTPLAWRDASGKDYVDALVKKMVARADGSDHWLTDVQQWMGV